MASNANGVRTYCPSATRRAKGIRLRQKSKLRSAEAARGQPACHVVTGPTLSRTEEIDERDEQGMGKLTSIIT
ncbi:hypothetical protein CCM_02596 [Cordyceps militaris CM01]|uniref:Uncharacterized protein n=1 Tax=Cordyceps militaris (strain CM01) TaxID=983644 RepID=G3JAK9_CORMM|nr:uncharacterized protein CCM_02596 [Cordyceps militaris CM01]EGX94325.1 hypothetical protein CCM_02596 [Cordyceps militaris CM01]